MVVDSSYRIVAFAPNEWRGPWMNRQQLLSRLGRWTSVLYSKGVWFTWDRVEPVWQQTPFAGRFEVQDNVWLDRPPRYLMRWQRFPAWDRVVLTIQGWRLRRFSAICGNGPLIGYVFNPVFVKDLAALKPDICVYHAYDLFKSTPSWNEKRAHQQRWLLSRAHLVIASSPVIAEALRAEGAEEVVVLPNGADVRAFSSAADSGEAAPEDIAVIPHPRIGYVGNLNRKVDFPLVERMARKNKDWQFVFVGALGSFDEITGSALERCQQLPNVHFLGGKHYSSLPRYVAAMDVNLMCYRTDAGLWTEGIYPLKLHEYLAAGKPVVSADIPSVREFQQVVTLVRDRQEWEEHIRSALIGNTVGSIEARRAVARENDWDTRVSVLKQHLDRLVQQRTARPPLAPR